MSYVKFTRISYLCLRIFQLTYIFKFYLLVKGVKNRATALLCLKKLCSTQLKANLTQQHELQIINKKKQTIFPKTVSNTNRISSFCKHLSSLFFHRPAVALSPALWPLTCICTASQRVAHPQPGRHLVMFPLWFKEHKQRLIYAHTAVSCEILNLLGEKWIQ